MPGGVLAARIPVTEMIDVTGPVLVSHGLGGVELDAIHPDILRQIAQDVIEQHLPPKEFDMLKIAERSEREIIKNWASGAARPGDDDYEDDDEDDEE